MDPYPIKPHWPVGTILDGTYYIGHWVRRHYYRVVGYTRSKAPRVEGLQRNVSERFSSPSSDSVVVSLEDPVCSLNPYEVFPARWSARKCEWRITDNDESVILEEHTPGSVYSEVTYY